MSILVKLAGLNHEEAFETLLRFCDLTDLTGTSDGDIYWGTPTNNKLLARGLFFAAVCSKWEEEQGKTGLLGWNGCLFGRYELECACMVSPSDDDDYDALRTIHSRQDVVRCVGDATNEITRMQAQANCQSAGRDAMLALADIFHGRHGWSCDELGFRPDQLLSSLPLPDEFEELLNNMRKQVGKDAVDE